MTKTELFTIAWEIASDLVTVYHMTSAQRKRSSYNVSLKQVSYSKVDNFSLALKMAWAEYKIENTTKTVKTVKNNKYVELLSVAERDNLNHGKSWVADGYTVDKNQLHPSIEGEYVCYVYVA